jgi:hypothetical protein
VESNNKAILLWQIKGFDLKASGHLRSGFNDFSHEMMHLSLNGSSSEIAT